MGTPRPFSTNYAAYIEKKKRETAERNAAIRAKREEEAELNEATPVADGATTESHSAFIAIEEKPAQPKEQTTSFGSRRKKKKNKGGGPEVEGRENKMFDDFDQK